MEMFFAGVGATVGMILLLSGVDNWLATRKKKQREYEQIVECFNRITDSSGNFTRRHLFNILMLELSQDQYHLQWLKKALEEVDTDASKLP